MGPWHTERAAFVREHARSLAVEITARHLDDPEPHPPSAEELALCWAMARDLWDSKPEDC